jgi:predicted transcriptional regulator
MSGLRNTDVRIAMEAFRVAEKVIEDWKKEDGKVKAKL